MKARRIPLAISALLLAAVLASCATTGSGGLTFTYSGTWSGPISDSLGGPGTVTATMSQSGANLVGTWQAAFNAGGNNGGTLAGIINGQEVLIEMYPSNPGTCPFAAVAQRSGSTLSGTYAAYNCTVAVTGTLSLTKQ